MLLTENFSLITQTAATSFSSQRIYRKALSLLTLLGIVLPCSLLSAAQSDPLKKLDIMITSLRKALVNDFYYDPIAVNHDNNLFDDDNKEQKEREENDEDIIQYKRKDITKARK